MTGGVILAAGLSSRMNAYKPLMEIAGKTMIQWSVEHMLSGGVDQIVIVTGHNNQLLTDYVKRQWRNTIQVVFNANYFNGKMFDSVQTGLAALKGCCQIFISLADMPAISPDSYLRLKREMVLTNKKVVIPSFEHRQCHPPLISADIAERILNYPGEDGLRGFWREVKKEILYVELADMGCRLDADRPEDVNRLESYLRYDGLVNNSMSGTLR